METSNYSDEFKRGAEHLITVRGYSVWEAPRRLGVDHVGFASDQVQAPSMKEF